MLLVLFPWKILTNTGWFVKASFCGVPELRSNGPSSELPGPSGRWAGQLMLGDAQVGPLLSA